jgi:hypothetical protein
LAISPIFGDKFGDRKNATWCWRWFFLLWVGTKSENCKYLFSSLLKPKIFTKLWHWGRVGHKIMKPWWIAWKGNPLIIAGFQRRITSCRIPKCRTN